MLKNSLLLSSCLFVVLFFSCKKDSGNSSSGYYIKASVGGTAKNYTVNTLATELNSNGTYSLGMAATATANTSTAEGLSFQIVQSAPITTGTYSENSSTATIAGIYNPGTSNFSGQFTAGLNAFTSNPFKITITQISTATVSGTFSGNFYSGNGLGSDSLAISNGSFNLPIH